MSSDEQARARGLPSIQKAREERSAGRHRWPSVKFWGYCGVVLAIGAILRWKSAQGEIESARQVLMARQRAFAAEFSPRWLPLRDKLERWTTELARGAEPEIVDQDALKSWDFRVLSGIYLRLRLEDATQVESVRRGASESLRDAFTACLMRAPNPNALAGRECKRTRDCPTGEFCNELDHCSRPAQPFNLRVAYRTLRVLSDDWVRDVQDADSDLRIRLLTASFDDTVQDDMPLATNFLMQAKYFLVVLDEPVVGKPGIAAQPAPDAGSAAAIEALQAVPHQARVGVWRLSDDKLILRIRRDAAGQLLGAAPNVDADVMDARQRQANSCALALEVRRAIGDVSAAVLPSPAP